MGLIMAFAVPASAVDVKFSGQYYVVGYHGENWSASDKDDSVPTRNLYATRTRIQTVFQIAEGLSLTTRFDALEKRWGERNWTGGTYDVTSRPSTGNASAAEQESIEFERAYVTFKTAIGQFDVGYQEIDVFGTVFGNWYGQGARIKYTGVFGPMTFIALVEKNDEGAIRRNTEVDSDKDSYAIAPIYRWTGGSAGLLIKYVRDATNSSLGVTNTVWLLVPYFQAKVGPVFVEGEAAYSYGESDRDVGQDVDIRGWAGYLKAQVDLAPVYFGVMGAYVGGDKATTSSKSEASAMGGGIGWEPTLILWNYTTATWMQTPGTGGYTATGAGSYYGVQMTNAWLGQVFVGIKPIPKLDIYLSYNYALVDQKPAGYKDDFLGHEVDLTATYKIYDNLSYMVGFGYLFVGDYFKGLEVQNNKIDDTYLVMHKLTLTF
jgi:hypothetical protein